MNSSFGIRAVTLVFRLVVDRYRAAGRWETIEAPSKNPEWELHPPPPSSAFFLHAMLVLPMRA